MTYKILKVSNILRTMAAVACIFFCLPSCVYSMTKDINILIQELKDRDPNIRGNAVYSISKKRNDVRIIKPLIDALKDKDKVVQSRTRQALYEIASHWKINDVSAVEPLVEAFKDEDEGVRAFSAMALGYIAALGKINNPRIIESLHALLNDKNSDVRDMADEALRRIKDAFSPKYSKDADINILIRDLKDKDSNVRYKAAKELRKRMDSRSIEPLIDALREIDSDVRREAAEALEQMAGFGKINDTRVVVPLIAILRDKNEEARVKQCAVGSLGFILSRTNFGKGNDTRIIESLIESLKDENSDIRKRAVSVIGKIKGARFVELLIDALEDEDTRVQHEAAEALEDHAYIGDGLDNEPLITVLKEKNLKVIAKARAFFIRKGIPDSEASLVEALWHYGDLEMANDFLNCGNEQLRKEAGSWARVKGYVIVPSPISSSLMWGK